MKVKFRLEITYSKPVPEFDGQVEWVTKDGNVPQKNGSCCCQNVW